MPSSTLPQLIFPYLNRCRPMLPLHLNELIMFTRIVSHNNNNNNAMDNCASLSSSVLIIAVKDPVLAANI